MAVVDVFFEDIHFRIKEILRSTSKSVHLAVAWFTDVSIYRELVDLSASGKEVSIVVANHDWNHQSRVDYTELLSNGGRVSYIGEEDDKLMHNKFCVIDKEVVLSGSYNWTYGARNNHENLMVVKDEPLLVQKFMEQFELLNPSKGFALEGNRVILRPIDEIVSKWSQKPTSSHSPVIPSRPAVDNSLKKISSKF